MSKSESYESCSSNEEINWCCHYLNGRYIILKKLGFGAYASVWLCYDTQESKYYAIKISNRDDYKTCVKETKVYNLVKKINCNHIMNLKQNFDHKIKDEESEEDEIYHCEIMELMGDSLYNYVKNNGCLSLDVVIKITKQILIALNSLHSQNIIHGDLKPENILLSNISNNTKCFIEKLTIEKIIKNKNLLKEQKTRKKILDEIKKTIEKIDINLDYNSDSVSYETSAESEAEKDNNSDFFSDDSISITYSLESSISSDDISNHSNKIDNSLKITSDFIIKLADLGGCVLDDKKRKKQIQTCYYMSPEILLRLPYDESSDIWALACSLYEILTGKILFDPDNYDGNEDRLHLHLMTQSLGSIPNEIINESRYKDIFFTCDGKRIRGFKNYEYNEIRKKLSKKIILGECNDETKEKFLDFFVSCLNYDKKKRITAQSSLNLDIFQA